MSSQRSLVNLISVLSFRNTSWGIDLLATTEQLREPLADMQERDVDLAFNILADFRAGEGAIHNFAGPLIPVGLIEIPQDDLAVFTGGNQHRVGEKDHVFHGRLMPHQRRPQADRLAFSCYPF